MRLIEAAAVALLAAAGTLIGAEAANAVPATFTKLTGITGGSPAGTAVYRADLSTIGLTEILSITIEDVSGGFGGATGQFSGFDLDAVVISTVLINDASNVGLLTQAATLDFGNSVFSPGTQRPPFDAKLFGTDGTGTAIDQAVATLDLFDGNSTTITPDGFLSLGDFGSLGINLLAALPISAPLYLYIGEVGDNGEVAGSNITISDKPAQVPEPATAALIGAGLLGLGLYRRQRAR